LTHNFRMLYIYETVLVALTGYLRVISDSYLSRNLQSLEITGSLVNLS
jgi:hypothetical protein